MLPDEARRLAPDDQRAREPLSAVFRVVIPARHGSTRLPGKPLASACRRADDPARASPSRCVPAPPKCIVATDDERIRCDLCARPGAAVEMTSDRARVGHRPHRRGRRAARLGGPGHRRQRAGRRAAAAARADRPGRRLLVANPAAAIATLATPIATAARIPRSQRRQGRHRAGRASRSISAARRFPGIATASRPRRRAGSPPRRAPPPRSLRLSRRGARAGSPPPRQTRSSVASGSNSCARSRWALSSSSRTRCETPGPGIDTPEDLARVEALLGARGRT